MILPIIDYLTPAITCIFNNSINSCTFPDSWKDAQIIPLPKKNNPSSYGDYRPISILPFLSKVLERLVHQQLNLFLSSYNLLNPFQSGFRSGHSTATALVKITDDIRLAMDNQEVTILSLLDFSNAFNTVDFDILLAILNSLNVSPSMPRYWCESRLRSTGKRRSIVLGSIAKRSRSRTCARGSRQRHRSPAELHAKRRDTERRRSRKSPPRKPQARSRSRSVVTSPLQRKGGALDTQLRESIDRLIDHRSSSRQKRHRLKTPCRERVSRSRSPVHDVNGELLKCIKESLQSISVVQPQSKDGFPNNNVVPEFDPKSKNQTIDTWLHKVKECSEIYG
ncbi:serine/arginine repetitive matrix protein 2-like [Nymphalis io]|uniref:serine/arginine repetitive matrix protein 2-like n=1 Tax=Inachis io TaxID=171585 RepID=UPI002168059D|nr:serine/arginine repetitive matrix protein 2-like [Nymphalis io]